MNTEIQRDAPGQFTNVKILLAVGEHQVRNNRQYSQVKKGIENLGLRFFKRGHANLLFLEDALATMEPFVDQMNESAKHFRSFRTAYWNVIQKQPKPLAKSYTLTYDQNTVERFLDLGKKTFLLWIKVICRHLFTQNFQQWIML